MTLIHCSKVQIENGVSQGRRIYCDFLGHRQVQLTAMKQNPCSVVGEVAKPTRIGLDELDGTVEAFRAGIADSVLTEVEQSFFVAPEHLDYLFDWLQLAAHRVVRPGLEETLGRALVAVAPELGEVLLDAPLPASFQVELVEGTKRDPSGHFFSQAHLLPVNGDVPA